MKQANSSIRIIGGKWRSRCVRFEDLPDLRPTPSRVRETLFNWLAPSIVGARCLDCFAGTGILGLEALSRGADRVIALESNPQAIRKIQANVAALETDSYEIIQTKANSWLSNCSERFDVIFLDPPYESTLLLNTFDIVQKNQLLRPNGLVYWEHNKPIEAFPGGKILKSKQAGQVFYGLASLEV